MIIVIERATEVIKKIKSITPQQMQALVDTEDYIVINIELKPEGDEGVKLVCEATTGDGETLAIEDGTIHQDSSIVQVR